jgi:hypothetical protein
VDGCPANDLTRDTCDEQPDEKQSYQDPEDVDAVFAKPILPFVARVRDKEEPFQDHAGTNFA